MERKKIAESSKLKAEREDKEKLTQVLTALGNAAQYDPPVGVQLTGEEARLLWLHVMGRGAVGGGKPGPKETKGSS